MAGSISADAVIWVAGESTGKDENGNSATLPTDSTLLGVTVGSGAPVGAPTQSQLYIRTDTRKSYAWFPHNGTWTTISGAP